MRVVWLDYLTIVPLLPGIVVSGTTLGIAGDTSGTISGVTGVTGVVGVTGSSILFLPIGRVIAHPVKLRVSRTVANNSANFCLFI